MRHKKQRQTTTLGITRATHIKLLKGWCNEVGRTGRRIEIRQFTEEVIEAGLKTKEKGEN